MAGTAREDLMRKAEEHGFSRDDAKQLLNFSKVMASQTVKRFLQSYIKDAAIAEGLINEAGEDLVSKSKGGLRLKTYKKIMGKLSRVDVCDFTGYQQITFTDADGVDHTLRYQLSIVPNDYEIELRIPRLAATKSDPIMKGLFGYLDRMIDIARQYYGQIVTQSRLVTDIAEFFPDIDVGQLQMNTNNRTLYLDEDYARRIGVLWFYVDSEGNPSAS